VERWFDLGGSARVYAYMQRAFDSIIKFIEGCTRVVLSLDNLIIRLGMILVLVLVLWELLQAHWPQR
jgi:hypothetical protein